MAPTAIPNEEQLNKVVVVGPGPRRRRRHAAPPPVPGARKPPDLHAEGGQGTRGVSDPGGMAAADGGGRIGGLTCGRGARVSRSGRRRIWGLRRRRGGSETGIFFPWGVKPKPIGGGLIRTGAGRVSERVI